MLTAKLRSQRPKKRYSVIWQCLLRINSTPNISLLRRASRRDRDPELSIDATPQDRARWLVGTQKDLLVDIISRLYILEAMGQPEKADQTLATITGSAPRSLANLSKIHRLLVDALHAKEAYEGAGIKSGDIVRGVELSTECPPTAQTIRKHLKAHELSDFVNCDKTGGHFLYWLTDDARKQLNKTESQ